MRRRQKPTLPRRAPTACLAAPAESAAASAAVLESALESAAAHADVHLAPALESAAAHADLHMLLLLHVSLRMRVGRDGGQRVDGVQHDAAAFSHQPPKAVRPAVRCGRAVWGRARRGGGGQGG
eukprot:363649-Chlamydomonas_euryale.AAC.6